MMDVAGFFAACVKAESMLPAYDALASAALAINLAYLNLERFRYRAQIRKHARAELDRLMPKDGALPERLAKNKWYRQVDRLAALPDHDPKKPGADKKADVPAGFWGWLYIHVFDRHQDRIASHVMTGLALAALFLGSAQKAKFMLSLSCFSDDGAGIFQFIILVLCTLTPIAFVFGGGKVVRWACGFSTECVRELEELMKGEVGKATMKGLPAAFIPAQGRTVVITR